MPRDYSEGHPSEPDLHLKAGRASGRSWRRDAMIAGFVQHARQDGECRPLRCGIPPAFGGLAAHELRSNRTVLSYGSPGRASPRVRTKPSRYFPPLGGVTWWWPRRAALQPEALANSLDLVSGPTWQASTCADCGCSDPDVELAHRTVQLCRAPDMRAFVEQRANHLTIND